MNIKNIEELEKENELWNIKAEIYIRKLKDLNLMEILIQRTELEHTLFIIIEQINKNSVAINNIKKREI